MSTPEGARASILGSSAVMAAGTVVSRASGFVRSALLAAALGTGLHADVFNIANTIPNMLYILLAGGMFNAVLVPQLIRAMRKDPDGGVAYTNRVVTAAGAFLLIATLALVVAAPWVMRLFLDGSFFTPEFAAQRESAIAFARYCLPQVFFYGMFVLVGQILNAHGRFGPMMWAPIANNVISVGVLGVYLLVFGPTSDLLGGYSTAEELLLGIGSTLGIAAQFLILIPFVRATGYRYRPRWDLRDSGLTHTLRLGIWTVGFVIVNQIAYTVVVRLASSGSAAAAAAGDVGSGYTIYAGAFLVVMVPHSVATVSLGTAVLPRISDLASTGDLRGLSRELARVIRIALSLILPFAVLLPVIADDVANLVWGYAAASDTFGDYATVLMVFAPGLVLFTVHYLVLRGFYALERTRTVFWIQCVIAASNIVFAVLLTQRVVATGAADALAWAYGAAYLVGAVTSYLVLRRALGGLETPALVRFLIRLAVVAGTATLVAWAVDTALLADLSGKLGVLLRVVAVTVVDVLVLILGARLLRVTEVTEIVGLVTTRLRGGRRD